MSNQRATAAVFGTLVLLAATAPSASAYPSSVSNRYTVDTTYGRCVIDVAARAEAGVAAVSGRLVGIESVNCAALTITPYRIYLSGGFSGTSLDLLDLLGSGEPDRICEWQKTCSWSRSEAWFPPGDHYVTHEVDIDVAPYAVGQTYVSFPRECRVAASDRGYLSCDFQQWVTMPAPSP